MAELCELRFCALHAELARIVNKVLGNDCLFHAFFLVKVHQKVNLPLASVCFKGVGVEVVEQWLRTDIVGCLQKFFIDCQKGVF